jgi:hypothetical protein
MKKTIALLALAETLSGCINGRNGPGDITRSRIGFKSPNGEQFDLDSHKDVKFEGFKKNPDGSITIDKYESRANDAVIEASSRQFDSMVRLIDLMQRNFNSGADRVVQKAGEVYTGGIVKPTPVQPQVITNYVTVTPSK